LPVPSENGSRRGKKNSILWGLRRSQNAGVFGTQTIRAVRFRVG
jgi:hypothetical protein